MIMKFALLLGYNAAALGMSMPTKDALPVRAQTFASLDRGDNDPVPHKAINDCSGPEPTKVIWTHDGHIDDLIAGIHLAKSPKYEIVGVVIGGTGEASSAHTGARNYLRVLEMLGLGHLADKHMVGVGPSIESFNEKFNQGEPADGGLECRFTDAWKEPGLHRDADLLGGVTNMLPFSEHSAYDLQKNVSDFEDAASAYEHGDPGGYDARAYAAHDYLSTSDEVFHESVKLGATTVLSTDTFTALYSFKKTYPKSFAKLTDLYYMGGSFDEAEANIRYDIPAANSVLSAPNLKIWTIDLDVTNMVAVDYRAVHSIAELASDSDATKELKIVSEMLTKLGKSPGQLQWGAWPTKDRPNDFALYHFDVVAAYAMVNKSAFTWEPKNVTVKMSSPLSASDGVYVEGGNKTWHVAKWTQDAADWMRYTHLPEFLNRKCISNQPPSFKELQQYYDCKEYGRTCHGDDGN